MPYLSIREASEDMRSWMTTPTELVEEALERIELLDGEIKAFITVLREQALAEAAKAEAEQRTGFYRSLLHGIPIGIKDIMAVKDVRMTAGSRVLADHVSLEDAMVVEQLRKAGAIMIGKTNAKLCHLPHRSLHVLVVWLGKAPLVFVFGPERC